METTRKERLALNEARIREVNEEIEKVARRLGRSPGEVDSQVDVICECGTRGCVRLVAMGWDEYGAIRDDPARFLVIAGHEQPEIERVVETHGAYLVVEKVGEAGAVARATDPRAQP